MPADVRIIRKACDCRGSFCSVCFSRNCVVLFTSFINSKCKEEAFLLFHVNKNEADRMKDLSAGNFEETFIHI